MVRWWTNDTYNKYNEDCLGFYCHGQFYTMWWVRWKFCNFSTFLIWCTYVIIFCYSCIQVWYPWPAPFHWLHALPWNFSLYLGHWGIAAHPQQERTPSPVRSAWVLFLGRYLMMTYKHIPYRTFFTRSPNSHLIVCAHLLPHIHRPPLGTCW
jgi:hypothetical protein